MSALAICHHLDMRQRGVTNYSQLSKTTVSGRFRPLTTLIRAEVYRFDKASILTSKADSP